MIRRAKLTDLKALLALENACFTSDLISPKSMRRFLQSATAEVLLFEEEKKILASSVLLFRKNSRAARMYSLAVAPTERKRGLASLLCQAMEKNAITRYSESLVLEVHPENTAAIRFYEKHGFHTFGKYLQFYECGSDAIRMKKRLREE